MGIREPSNITRAGDDGWIRFAQESKHPTNVSLTDGEKDVRQNHDYRINGQLGQVNAWIIPHSKENEDQTGIDTGQKTACQKL